MKLEQYNKIRKAKRCVDCRKKVRDGQTRCLGCRDARARYMQKRREELAALNEKSHTELETHRIERMLSLIAVIDRLGKRLEVA